MNYSPVNPQAAECRGKHWQHPGWIDDVVMELQRQGGTGFRDRHGHLIVITRSAKESDCWQATWFKPKGPYQDRLSKTPKQLLLAIAPALREWLSLDTIEWQINRWLSRSENITSFKR